MEIYLKEVNKKIIRYHTRWTQNKKIMNTQYTMVDSSNNYFFLQRQAVCAKHQAYSTIDYKRWAGE